MNKKIYIILSSLVFLILTLYIFGFYPAIKVNGEWISQRKIARQAEIMKKVREESVMTSRSDIDFELASRAIFLKDALIKDRVEKEFDKETLNKLIKDQLLEMDDEDMGSFAKLLGLSSEEALEFWLLPTIREDILKSKLVLKGEDFNKWLEEAKKSADVTLFSRKFRWEGTSIQKN